MLLWCYPHADDGHPQVGAPEVHSQGTLGLQDVVDVLGDGVLHRGEAEGLLQRLVQVNAAQELEDARHGVAVTVDLGADRRGGHESNMNTADHQAGWTCSQHPPGVSLPKLQLQGVVDLIHGVSISDVEDVLA